MYFCSCVRICEKTDFFVFLIELRRLYIGQVPILNSCLFSWASLSLCIYIYFPFFFWLLLVLRASEQSTCVGIGVKLVRTFFFFSSYLYFNCLFCFRCLFSLTRHSPFCCLKDRVSFFFLKTLQQVKITQHWKIVLSFKLSLDYHYYKCRFVCRSIAVFVCVCVCLRRLCFFGLFLLSLFKYIYIYIVARALF